MSKAQVLGCLGCAKRTTGGCGREQPIAILDRKLGRKYHYVRGTSAGRRLTTLRSISRQPTGGRHVSAASPDLLRTGLLGAHGTLRSRYPPARSSSSRVGKRMAKGKNTRDRLEPEQVALPLLLVGSGASTATGRDDRSCKTAVRHPCRQARAATAQQHPQLPTPRLLLLTRLAVRQVWVVLK